MKSKINFYLLEFALSSLIREKSKNIFVFVVLSLLIFLLSSVFFITNSLKYELQTTLDALPQIIVQKIKAGREYDVDISMVDAILEIKGVENAYARVWGYYYFANGGVNFSVVGVDEFEKSYKKSFVKLTQEFNQELFQELNSTMVVGLGVKKVLQNSYYKEYFNFIKPDGTLKKVYIAGVFDGASELESNDVIVMSNENVREIFKIQENKATDIVVDVANPKEVTTVVQKIKELYPDTRVLTKEDLRVSYQNIFDYKSGVFLALFIVSLFTFFMIIYDKMSGLSSEAKREIGVLKAIGWKVDDILKEKFYEGFILSFFAYVVGVMGAMGFVYIFHAPVLRKVFEGYSELKTSFTLPFVVDVQTFFLIFFLSVPIFIAATLIPSWRAATLDADEVMR